MDLPIGKVSILALSAEDSVLAATVGRDIHFFAVSALLHKVWTKADRASPRLCIIFSLLMHAY